MKYAKSIDRLALAAMIAASTFISVLHNAYAESDAPHGMHRIHVLTDDLFNTLQFGATESQVLEAIGPPARKEEFRRTHTVAWDYPYRDAWGYDAEFAAIFDDHGVMVGKFSTRDSG